MNPGNIVEKLKAYIITELLYASDIADIAAEDDLLATGILDSMSAARLSGYIEEQYEIKISAADFTFENFNNLQSLAALVQRKQSMSPEGF